MHPDLPGRVSPGATPDTSRGNVSLTTRPSAAGSLAGSLSSGDTVSARVLGTGSSGGVALRIAGQVVEAALPSGSTLRLHTGQSLQLQVSRLMPALELRLMNPSRDGAPEAGMTAQALRASLPAQQPVAQALKSVEALTAGLERALSTERHDPALRGLGEQLRALARTLADVRQLADPAVLRERVQRSGTFLESTLAAMQGGSLAPSSEQAASLAALSRADLKAQLLSLRDALRAMLDPGLRAGADTASPSAGSQAQIKQESAYQAAQGRTGARDSGQGPSASDGAARASVTVSQAAQSLSQILEPMRQAVDGGIARIEVNQLLSTRGAPDGQPALYVDLPVRVGERCDDVNMVFTRHRRGQGEEAEQVWNVSMDIEPPGLGRIAVQVSLAGGAISTALVAEQDLTHARLDAGLPDLADALRSAGCEVSAVSARKGKADGSQRPEASLPPLLSVKA